MRPSQEYLYQVETKIIARLVESLSGCWEFAGPLMKDGYGRVRLEGKPTLTHRASYIYHTSSIPEGLHILHKCDNPCCCNPAHLYAGTHHDNMKDKVKRARQYRPNHVGVNNTCSKLTDSDVVAIFTSTKTTKELCKEFPVGRASINLIKQGKSWKHVTDSLQRH